MMEKDQVDFGNVRKPSEPFRKVRKGSEELRKRSEAFRTTVREAAQEFEKAGVPRTERSIINWCRPNRDGLTRLECYLDENEGKYFITPQSLERVMSEELAKGGVLSTRIGEPSVGENAPAGAAADPLENELDEAKSLKLQLNEQRFLNKAKDMLIEELRKDRAMFAAEQRHLIEQISAHSREIGRLENRLLALEGGKTGKDSGAPTGNPSATVPPASEGLSEESA